MTNVVAVPRLFSALVDDAGLFPPEELPMAAAVARHRADAAGAHPVLTHRFLCPAGRLPQLFNTLGAADRFALGLITDLDPRTVGETLDLLAAEPRATPAVLEGPLPSGPDGVTDSVKAARLALAALDEVPAGVPCHVEVPLAEGWQDVLDVIAEGGRAAKVRCGGVRAELFPDAERLAAFVHGCAVRGVPFKATAGLHHAVRYRDERTGFVHHGFLNLVLAACRVVDGGTAADAVQVLHSGDAAALAAEARQVTPGLADAVRELFVAYGSCSTGEPLEDLLALGLIRA